MSERLTEEQVAAAVFQAEVAIEANMASRAERAVLQLHADLEEAKSSAMYANQHVEADKAFRTRVMNALGNGADEALWPPGVHWSDAAAGAIRALSSLREAAWAVLYVLSDDHDVEHDPDPECPCCAALVKLRSLLEVKA